MTVESSSSYTNRPSDSVAAENGSLPLPPPPPQSSPPAPLSLPSLPPPPPPPLPAGMAAPQVAYSMGDPNVIARSSVRNSLTSYDIPDSPISPRSQVGSNPSPWGHQRSTVDSHRAALEPPIGHRGFSHYPSVTSAGGTSSDFRSLPSPAVAFGGRSNSAPHAFVAAGLSIAETFEPRNGYSHTERSQYPLPPPPPPPIGPDHAAKAYPPQLDHRFSQSGAASRYAYSTGSVHGAYRSDSYDSYQHQESRRHPAAPLHPDPLRPGPHAPAPPAVLSPIHDSTRQSNISGYIPGGPDAGPMPPMQSTENISRNPVLPSVNSPVLALSPLREPHHFQSRPHDCSSPPSVENTPCRNLSDVYSSPSQGPTGSSLPKIINPNPYERPVKRQKTDESGGGHTDTMEDTDDEEEEDEEEEYGAGDQTMASKKRKHFQKNGSRTGAQRKRSSSRIYNGDNLDETDLPEQIDGIPVNKEWGLTKAGKARQRLPQACIACRKKKIKCIISKGQKICEKCKAQNTECLFKSSTSSRSKHSSALSDCSQTPGKTESEFSAADTPRKFERRESLDDISFEEKGLHQGIYFDDEEDCRRPEEPIVKPCSTAAKQSPVKAPPFVTGLEEMSATDSASPEANFADQRAFHVQQMQVHMKQSQQQARPRQSSFSTTQISSPASSVTSDLVPPSNSHPVARTPRHSPYSSAYSKRQSATPGMGTPPFPTVSYPIGSDARHPALPAPEVLDNLVNSYFTYVYPQHYPFLHKKTFMQNMSKHQPVLLFSLCAIAARFSLEFKEFEEAFALQARQAILENFDNNCLEVVQAMVLMGLHDFGSNNGNKAWMFCGMAVRMGAALHLNLENNSLASREAVDQEAARRTYWSYYLMDRLNSYGVSRPYLTQDHDCQIQLPCDQVSFENQKLVPTEYLNGKNPRYPQVGNKYMGAFAYLVRISSIWGNILKHVHLAGTIIHKKSEVGKKNFHRDEGFDNLINQIQQWKNNLPQGLRYSSENLGGQIRAGTVGAFVMMHLMFHTCIAYVHRFVRVVLPGKPNDLKPSDLTQQCPESLLRESLMKVFYHSTAVMEIMLHVRQKKKEVEINEERPVTVIAPFIGQAISDACDVLILGGRGATPLPDKFKEKILVGLEWLNELRGYWKPIDKMYQKLQKAYKKLDRKREAPSDGSSESVSPKTQAPYDSSTFIPSPESANSQLRMYPHNLIQYPSPIDTTTSLDGMYDFQPVYSRMVDAISSLPPGYFADTVSYTGTHDTLENYINSGAFHGLGEFYMDFGPFIISPQVSTVAADTAVLAEAGVGINGTRSMDIDDQVQQQQQLLQQPLDQRHGMHRDYLEANLDINGINHDRSSSEALSDSDDTDQKEADPEKLHLFFDHDKGNSDIVRIGKTMGVTVEPEVDEARVRATVGITSDMADEVGGYPPGGADADHRRREDSIARHLDDGDDVAADSATERDSFGQGHEEPEKVVKQEMIE